MFVMWLGEKITDKGIGNGISLIIMIGIVARLPSSFIFESGTRMNGAGGAIALIVEILFLFVVVLGTILLVQGTRRVPVQYARRIVGNKQYGGVRQYIPLKGKCCRCDAYYICPGHNDVAYYNSRIFF